LVLLARYPKVTLRVTLLRTMEGRRQHRSLMSGPSIGPEELDSRFATDWTTFGRITMSTHDHLRLVDTDEPAERRPPPTEVTLLTIPEAAKFLRIGRSAAYELARRFEATGGAEGLPCVRIGDRLLRVPVDALREMVTIRA